MLAVLFYVQEVRSVFMFQTKTKYLHPCRQYRGSVYVQEVRSVFMFQTKTKYLHPCRQYRGCMDAQERVCTGSTVSTYVPDKN